MDNLAHTLAGAALAEAGLKRRTALATATLVIGANLPDVDIVAALFDQSLAWRRGWTHGVAALFVLPLLLTVGMLLWSRIRRPAPAAPPVEPTQILLLAFIGVFSHPVLDWLNTYGLRWLMPFDRTWFYGDALFIVDPWLWLILLAGTVGARRTGRVRAGRLAIGVAAVYMATMVASAQIGRSLVADSLREGGFEPVDVMVGPVPLNPNRRQVVVAEEGRYLLGTLDWLPRPRLTVDSLAIARNDHHPAARVAASVPDAAGFLGWARFPFYVITERGEGYDVVIDDLRYSDGLAHSWAAVRVRVGSDAGGGGVGGRPVETAFLGGSYEEGEPRADSRPRPELRPVGRR